MTGVQTCALPISNKGLNQKVSLAPSARKKRFYLHKQRFKFHTSRGAEVSLENQLQWMLTLDFTYTNKGLKFKSKMFARAFGAKKAILPTQTKV